VFADLYILHFKCQASFSFLKSVFMTVLHTICKTRFYASVGHPRIEKREIYTRPTREPSVSIR